MTSDFPKGRSPFYPGQPVPIELFVGRASELNRIVRRGVAQTEAGKPVALYIEGEYGIGKSSIAAYTISEAEANHGLHGIYATLGGVDDKAGLGSAMLRATVLSGAFDRVRMAKLREWLAKYIGHQTIAGVEFRFDALRADAPQIAGGILPFLAEVKSRLEGTGVKGVVLVLDEINGIAGKPFFAHFVKGLADTNAMRRPPLPLMLMLCGVAERRREMIRCHPPVERIFDVIEISSLTAAEMTEFFQKAFATQGMTVNDDAMRLMILYAAGFPKIMHQIGDSAYWTDSDGVIDLDDATQAITMAAEDIGRKYVDHQVFAALRGEDYHSILRQIAGADPASMSIRRSEVIPKLNDAERAKFDNFLRKMERLRVLTKGTAKGEDVFTSRIVRLYRWMQSARASPGA